MAEEDEEWLEEATAAVPAVRALCRLYEGSAERVAKKEYPEDDEMMRYEIRRYLEGRNKALESALKLKDDFCRATALHSVLELCMKAHDVQAAAMIAKAITVETIQSVIFEQHPEFFEFDDNDRRLHPTAAAAAFPLLKL
jgi:hypothetical protein